MAKNEEKLNEMLESLNGDEREMVKTLCLRQAVLEIADEEKVTIGAMLVVGIMIVQEAAEAMLRDGADFEKVRDGILDNVESMLDETIAPRVAEIKAEAEERSHENTENEEKETCI